MQTNDTQGTYYGFIWMPTDADGSDITIYESEFHPYNIDPLEARMRFYKMMKAVFLAVDLPEDVIIDTEIVFDDESSPMSTIFTQSGDIQTIINALENEYQSFRDTIDQDKDKNEVPELVEVPFFSIEEKTAKPPRKTQEITFGFRPRD